MPQTQKFVFNKDDNNTAIPSGDLQSDGYLNQDILGSASHNTYLAQANNWTGDFKSISTITDSSLSIPNATINAFDFIVLNPDTGSCAVDIDLTQIGTDQLSIGQLLTFYNATDIICTYEISASPASQAEILPGEVIKILIKDGSSLLVVSRGESPEGLSGQIVWAHSESVLPFAAKMIPGTDVLVRDELFNGASPNRLIDLINANPDNRGAQHSIASSKNTLVCAKIPPQGAETSRVELYSGMPLVPQSGWVSNSTASTITQGSSYDMAIIPEILYSNGKPTASVKFTWSEDGASVSGIWNYATKGGDPLVRLFDGGVVENTLTSVMASYFGFFLAIVDGGDGGTGAEFYNTIRYEGVSTGSPTEKSSCIVNFENIQESIEAPTGSLATSIPVQPTPKGRSLTYDNFYLSSNIYSNVPHIDGDGIYPVNFLAWGEAGTTSQPNGTSIGTPYKYVLTFTKDGATDHSPSSATGGIKRTISVSDASGPFDPIKVAQSVVDTVAIPAVSVIAFSALPVNGEYEALSIFSRAVTWIYWNKTTSPTPPSNPVPGSIPVLIEYESTTTGSDFSDACALAHNRAFCGVPEYREIFSSDSFNGPDVSGAVAPFMYL